MTKEKKIDKCFKLCADNGACSICPAKDMATSDACCDFDEFDEELLDEYLKAFAIDGCKTIPNVDPIHPVHYMLPEGLQVIDVEMAMYGKEAVKSHCLCRRDMKSNLINGRTPKEIKHVTEWACFSCGGIECDECEYKDACTIENRDRAVPDALAYIERLEAAQPKWISVEERLPEADGEYLVLKRHNYRKDDGYMAQEVALFLKTREPEWVVGNLCEVTHWMSLPKPPEVEA